MDRIHRIGLDRDELVSYHILIADNTIDETIHRRLIEKEVNMLKILDDDLPIGSFAYDEFMISQSEEDATIDFEETTKDIKQQLSKN